MYPYTLFCIISAIVVFASSQHDNHPNARHQQPTFLISRGNGHRMQNENPPSDQKVKLQLYYESLCPACRFFIMADFAQVVKNLSDHLEVHVYPYGNAKTIIDKDGKVEITCQHGTAECYGNMLHACAIDNLNNITTAVLFNACMMLGDKNNLGSDDQGADRCGKLMNIDSEPIKSCAKGPRGFELLKAYGEESKKAGFNAVPYLLLNGKENDGDVLLIDICAQFVNPPDACNEINN